MVPDNPIITDFYIFYSVLYSFSIFGGEADAEIHFEPDS